MLIGDDLREARLQRCEVDGEAGERGVVNDAKARAWRQIQVGRVDDSLDVPARPRRPREGFELRDVVEHARAGPEQRDDIGGRVCMQVQLRIDLALRGQRYVEFVQQPALVFPGLDPELGARRSVDDAYVDAGMANAVAELGGEIPLDLLAAEVLDARQDAANQHLGPALGK